MALPTVGRIVLYCCRTVEQGGLILRPAIVLQSPSEDYRQPNGIDLHLFSKPGRWLEDVEYMEGVTEGVEGGTWRWLTRKK